MKPRVAWNGLPAEHRRAFEPYVKRYLPSLPCWVEVLTVSYDNDPPEEKGDVLYLAVSAQEEMREVEMFYRPSWLELDEVGREEKASHEFAHIPGLPAFDICDSLLKEGAATQTLRAQYEKRVEAATQDYARILRVAYARRPE